MDRSLEKIYCIFLHLRRQVKKKKWNGLISQALTIYYSLVGDWWLFVEWMNVSVETVITFAVNSFVEHVLHEALYTYGVTVSLDNILW